VNAARTALATVATSATVAWVLFPEVPFWLTVCLWVAVIAVEIAWLVADWRRV
jgi:hypothetical protein